MSGSFRAGSEKKTFSSDAELFSIARFFFFFFFLNKPNFLMLLYFYFFFFFFFIFFFFFFFMFRQKLGFMTLSKYEANFDCSTEIYFWKNGHPLEITLKD